MPENAAEVQLFDQVVPLRQGGGNITEVNRFETIDQSGGIRIAVAAIFLEAPVYDFSQPRRSVAPQPGDRFRIPMDDSLEENLLVPALER